MSEQQHQEPRGYWKPQAKELIKLLKETTCIVDEKTVERFTTIQHLTSEGVTSHVYAAYDRALGIPVALKWAKNEDVAERLRGEIKFLKQYDGHEHILRYYADFVVKDRPLLVIELADADLQVHVEASMPNGYATEEGRTIFQQLCSALQEIHRRNNVHRDIRPANILLLLEEGKVPTVKLGDLGELKTIPASRISREILGQYAYRPPEVIYDESRKDSNPEAQNSPQADIYAAGAVLFFVLTGKELFHHLIEDYHKRLGEREAKKETAKAKSLLEYLELEMRKLRDRGVKEDLITICRNCIEPDRERRYHSIEEILEALNSPVKRASIPTPQQRLRVAKEADAKKRCLQSDEIFEMREAFQGRYERPILRLLDASRDGQIALNKLQQISSIFQAMIQDISFPKEYREGLQELVGSWKRKAVINMHQKLGEYLAALRQGRIEQDTLLRMKEEIIAVREYNQAWAFADTIYPGIPEKELDLAKFCAEVSLLIYERTRKSPRIITTIAGEGYMSVQEEDILHSMFVNDGAVRKVAWIGTQSPIRSEVVGRKAP
ncbi:protein kinase [Candidatus Woesearchaeota archaeon]|nr:protein kinase [Candidatus Woesearchaeota archaeon]